MDRELFIHRLGAALVFIFSLIVYSLTIAPTTSFWDCGEFITCAYILGVPHPPGAPFYLLLGRIFSMIPWAADIGLRVNLISAIATALTVMLTYLIIVRLIKLWRGQIRSGSDRLIHYGSAIIGALAFAFSDSLWFNAVEAEVYAISMFFTAIVLWLILVWHEKADDPHSDKYLFLIAYSIGLAIGIHLLNILALPAIFLIYYFRRYQFRWSSFAALIGIGLLIFIGIYPGIVKWLPNSALNMQRQFGPELTAAFFIAMAVMLCLVLWWAWLRRHRSALVVGVCLLLILIGASTFTSVYLRSQLNPAIDENDPENLANLVSYINREQYGDWSITERRAPLWEYQIKKMYLRYLGWQYIGKGTTIGPDGFLAETISLSGLLGIPFLIGLLGMVHHFFKDYRRSLAIMVFFIMTGVAIVIYLNQTDPQPRERDYVYVASFFAFAIWIGIGVASVLESLLDGHQATSRRQKIMAIGLWLVLFIFIPLRMLAFNYHSHDRSGNYVAYDYSYNLLQSCEKDAILFTNGDNDTFPLWFLQYVENIRPDIRVVNLSLLNTPWYIKQLRDQPPRVPISLVDAQIDRLSTTYWPEKKPVSIDVPLEAYQKALDDLEQRQEFVPKTSTGSPKISFELGPTFMGQAIRIQDIMILNIIAANRFRQPIYFAVTVSPDNLLNLHDYLRMDGLAYKLVTYLGDKISPSRLRENLFEKFRYRNLNNPKIYYDDNIIGLLINYRSGFLRLANFYRQEKMTAEMLATLDRMEQMIPENVIPIQDRRLSLGIGQLYLEAGRPEEFARRLELWLQKPGISLEERLEFAQVYYQMLADAPRSEAIARTIIQEAPQFLRAYYWLLNLYAETQAYQKGLQLADELLQRQPNDVQALARRQQFQQKLQLLPDSSKSK
ncbi:MAG: DUF2723 domain-containing protein [candidate division KSB1 bacterium]|nr:DUF2723 domain-containing protein [candidate division KSB1 bacterium]MDZ7318266.1 DUF2723 domain-containing protein [candidate division KSB1 bacterium]MDZ7340142.1 DUF2723 domain-containing protein [candidate division KSB1 bacterium]